MRALFLFLPWAVAAQTATYNIRPIQGNRFALEVFKSKVGSTRSCSTDSADCSFSIASTPSDRASGLSWNLEVPDASTIGSSRNN
jgi:hypothetical protein